ncbi:DUF6221 family protein [Nocardia brasiliensis]|uniref:DUF6221 family protein n=1 Tax=Nocardia brasiliensis TaxID=37326 RepID=UPI002456ACEA|nr:DUF6221 family protein [Nocardia brasiliensis]
MTTEQLARLTAGLAEDERIARAANEADYPGASTWDGLESRMFRHAQRQAPKATLDRVEAIRRVMARHHPETVSGVVVHFGDAAEGMVQVCAGCGNRGNGFGYTPWPCPDVLDLASIYPDPTEES